MIDNRLGQNVEILLVEDNPGDIRLIVEVLKEGKINNNLSVVEDGEQALAYLRREGELSAFNCAGHYIIRLKSSQNQWDRSSCRN